MTNNKPLLFAFDINSHLGRVYTVQEKKNLERKNEGEHHNGEPVFCLKPLLRIVESEIRAMEKLGYYNTHIVIVFDHEYRNFRYDIYEDYKGNRPPKPHNWKRQEELAFQMFEALGFTCLRIPGVEADDVVATLAHKLSLHDFETVIFTGDKDIMSCCNKNVSVYAGSKKKLYKLDDVKDFLGIPASKVLDFLAIDGDKADNIPGLKGAGAKSAIELLNNYALDEVIKNPGLIQNLTIKNKKKIEEIFRGDLSDLYLSRELTRLKLDVELGINLNEMKRTAPRYESFLNGYMRPQY